MRAHGPGPAIPMKDRLHAWPGTPGMVRTRLPLAAALVAALTSCGDVEPPTALLAPEVLNPDPTLAGTFYGRFQGLDQGVGLSAVLAFTFAESSGALLGTFTIEGVLDDGQSPADVAGSGYLAGTVSADDLAAVSFTTQPEFCPSQTGGFTGLYNRQTGVLGVAGTVVVVNQFCVVVLTYPIDLAMRR